MTKVDEVSVDEPMPKPEIIIKEFDTIAPDVVLTEHPFKLGDSVDTHRIDFTYGSIKASVWTEMRMNGLFYHIGVNYQIFSIICQTEEIEAQFRRIFMLTLSCFSKYPKVDPKLQHHRKRVEQRKKYFKTAFWKSDWEMPSDLAYLYGKFYPWASSVRTKINKAKFEVEVSRFKDQLKGICPHFSRDELVQILDETLSEQVLGS